ncbi:MAG: Nif3-like dinuclear metal center hexameric protein [Mucilaginibacter sp.]|nr:Nif3-like dinuclear metal center hexameric protein [Mucilaginibacter sp.]
MLKQITAQQVIDRIKAKCGTTWKDTTTDVFNTGSPDAVVTGIATSFTPSIEVLKKAVAAGKNMIITQQPAYYLETAAYLKNDQAYLYKSDYIAKNNLILWRFFDNWNNLPIDGQLKGLAKALGWDKYHPAGYAKENKYFKLPPATLHDMVIDFKKKLNIPAIRVIGDPNTKITKAALSHGMFKLAELQEFLRDPEVNLIVIAEAIEWEACEYFRDILTWKGHNKAMILIGREASEDPGYGEVAAWLKPIITEVPVTWIPANEPFWIPA